MKTSELANSHPAAMRKLGSSIRTLRKQAGYTIDELATIAGISAKTLARIEKAESSVTVNKLFVLSEALGIAPDELIRRVSHASGNSEMEWPEEALHDLEFARELVKAKYHLS